MSRDDCCHDHDPETGDDLTIDNITVRETAAKVERANSIARRLEVGLVALAAAALVGLVVSDVRETGRIRALAAEAKEASEARLDDERRRSASAMFGQQVVRCILSELAEHRVRSDSHHKEIAGALGLAPPEGDAPSLFSDQDSADAVCRDVIAQLEKSATIPPPGELPPPGPGR